MASMSPSIQYIIPTIDPPKAMQRMDNVVAIPGVTTAIIRFTTPFATVPVIELSRVDRIAEQVAPLHPDRSNTDWLLLKGFKGPVSSKLADDGSLVVVGFQNGNPLCFKVLSLPHGWAPGLPYPSRMRKLQYCRS
jgi:hypothetical protein